MGPSPSSALQPGQTFGRYQILSTVGVGSFGVVYEAVQYPLNRRVALKLLHDRTLTHPDALARFEREAMAAARLHHPHVVEVYDYGAQDGVAFLAMEFLEGESFQGLMRRAGPLPVYTLADLMLPVVSAVAAVHDAGIVHRDLKPENVLLTVTEEGRWHPKLLDFGIAKVETTGPELTRTNALLGTPCYMSPEQVMQARSIDGRADQWSLGVVMYEAITGRKPFYSDTLLVLMTAITSEDAAPPRAYRPDLDPAFEALIGRALQRRPEGRFRSMRELGAALLPFASPPEQQRWYDEFVAGAPGPAYLSSSPSFPAARPVAAPPSFHVPVDDEVATRARPSLVGVAEEPPRASPEPRYGSGAPPFAPEARSSGGSPEPPPDEPTELVTTTSQDGEFPEGMPVAQSLRDSILSSVRPRESQPTPGSEPGSRTFVAASQPGAQPATPREEVGTGTLAMDLDTAQTQRPPRQPTGRMPPWKSTVEMATPVPVVPVPGAPPLYGVPPSGGYPVAPDGAPLGTINMASGEVSRPAPPPSRRGRTLAFVALASLLGVAAFSLALWKASQSRADDAPQFATHTPGLAPQHAGAPDAAAAPPPAAPDASAAPVVAPVAVPDAAVAVAAPDAAAVVAAPDAAVAQAVDAAAPTAPPPDERNARAPGERTRRPERPRRPRPPRGPRPGNNAPIF